MTIPYRPLGMIDIREEVYPPSHEVIGLRDPDVMSVVGVPLGESVTVLDAEGKSSQPPIKGEYILSVGRFVDILANTTTGYFANVEGSLFPSVWVNNSPIHGVSWVSSNGAGQISFEGSYSIDEWSSVEILTTNDILVYKIDSASTTFTVYPWGVSLWTFPPGPDIFAGLVGQSLKVIFR